MKIIALEEHMFPHDILVAANLDLGLSSEQESRGTR